jgi:signal transduction histidine kinase
MPQTVQQLTVILLTLSLLYSVSHELGTPLASLRGFAELLLAREFPPKRQREIFTVLQTESLRLTRLINDFLDRQRRRPGALAAPALGLPW